MSLAEKFDDLDYLKDYIIEHIDLDNNFGFRFHKVHPGMTFDEATVLMGTPNHLLLDRDSQQTAEYLIPVLHGIEKPHKNRSVRMLLWAFNREPIKILEMKLNFPRNWRTKEDYTKFLKSLIHDLVEIFGKPNKKSLRNRKEILLYDLDNYKLHIWYSNDGLRIQWVNKQL